VLDSWILLLNTLGLCVLHVELFEMHQEYSSTFGHWAFYREKWPEEKSSWVFCYNDILFNRFVFTKKHFGWYWWPKKIPIISYSFVVESPTDYLYSWFDRRNRVAFFLSDRFYTATDNTFRYAKIQRFYFEQLILCDYHFNSKNPQPKYVYTSETYEKMFFFMWFTMNLATYLAYFFN